MTRRFRLGPVLGRASRPSEATSSPSRRSAGPCCSPRRFVGVRRGPTSRACSYAALWGHHLTIGWGSFAVSEDLRHWVNDGLMTVFFFVVGSRDQARARVRASCAIAAPRASRSIAAIGGMVVPALLYIAVNAGGAGSRGWAIPMATDIAFAVVVLAVLGSRVPTAVEAVPADARDRRRHRRDLS